MNRQTIPDWQPEVADTLRALGGEGTLGDLVAITGLPRAEVSPALEALIRADRAGVRVSESGHVVYRLDAHTVRQSRRWARPSDRSGQIAFDRKTLRLIRCREGVLSLAELVEHTGLPLPEARREMARLAQDYGGEPHPSWDGHVVWAFPELMSSAHGRFAAPEPKPAWVRAEDPVEKARVSALGWFGRLLHGLRHSIRHRFRDRRTLRRYALGHVVQTALAGKGVVSLEGTVRYLRRRVGTRRVSRAAVEGALRQLADEFDAPVTEIGGDLFFGFRNVKRQFLASRVVRRRICLGSTASGRVVYDSSDSPAAAAERELELFDAELAGPAPIGKEKHGVVRRAE